MLSVTRAINLAAHSGKVTLYQPSNALALFAPPLASAGLFKDSLAVSDGSASAIVLKSIPGYCRHQPFQGRQHTEPASVTRATQTDPE